MEGFFLLPQRLHCFPWKPIQIEKPQALTDGSVLCALWSLDSCVWDLKMDSILVLQLILKGCVGRGKEGGREGGRERERGREGGWEGEERRRERRGGRGEEGEGEEGEGEEGEGEKERRREREGGREGGREGEGKSTQVEISRSSESHSQMHPPQLGAADKAKPYLHQSPGDHPAIR